MHYTVLPLPDSLPRPIYEEGGALPYGMIGSTAGALVGGLDALDGEQSDWGQYGSSMLRYAGTGASIGTMLAPGVGTAIGAGVGALAGGLGTFFTQRKEAKEVDRLKQEGLEQRRRLDRDMAASYNASVLSAFPVRGVTKAGYYANGGPLTPGQTDKLMENGEVLFSSDALPPLTDQHGLATKISPNHYRLSGVSHNHPSGGIGVARGEAPFVDQQGKSQPSGFVFSNRLKADDSYFLRRL